MTRRTLPALCALAALLSAVPAAETKPRPNILFIMADDNSRQSLGCYNGRYRDLAPTPNIDRLAAEGMKFEHMTASNSICVPSRAALITGKFSHLNGVKVNADKFDGSQQTFPKLLQQAGYTTAIFGKWHLGTQPTGFDHYEVLNGQGQYNNCPLLVTGKAWNPKEAVPTQGYLTDVLTDRAIDWLNNRPKDKPFCLMLHHKATHGPHQPAPRHAGFLDGVVLPEPDNLLDDYAGRALKDVETTNKYNRMEICAEREYQPLVAKYKGDRATATREIYQAYMRNYLRLVKSLDENVGRLLDCLDQAGLAGNTVVIYTSDNGFFNGEHGLYNKMWMYEESLHLPLLVRYPGVTAKGGECSQLASMLDIAPTLLDIAGAPIPHDLQGASLLPLLRGAGQPVRDALYYHYYAQYNAPEQFGVRTPTHKLVHYPGLTENNWELFDLRNDPSEMKNLYHSPEQKATLDELRRLLSSLIQRYNDTTATLE